MKPGEVLASLVAIFGIGWLVYGRKPPEERDAAPQRGQGEGFEPPKPLTLDEGKAARLRGHLAAMTEGFRSVVKRDPTVSELLYMTAIPGLETSWGKGWKCTKNAPPECASSEAAAKASNNWGAIQANSAWKGATFDWFDSYPDGRKYTQKFRAYPTPADGAADVVKFISRLPRTMEALADGVSIYRMSLGMRREKYYGSFCPKAVAKYGAEIAKPSFSNPDRDAGTLACEAEAVGLHAGTAYRIALELASAAGLRPIPLGTFEDAFTWYKGTGSQA